MGVLLVNTALGVRRLRSRQRDGHGWPQPGPGWEDPVGPWPGRTAEDTDGSWLLGLDPRGWPLAGGDLVIEPDTGREWLVLTADLLRNNLDPTVDYVRVTAHERGPHGTEAGSALTRR